MGYTTRYPPRTWTVAIALLEIFGRHGIPQEVLSDQGTEFMSELMKCLFRKLEIRGIKTTPYHPECSGLVERFKGTVKAMLRRCCQAEPDRRNELLPSMLFAYRELPQQSTGYSPFEQLYLYVPSSLSFGRRLQKH